MQRNKLRRFTLRTKAKLTEAIIRNSCAGAAAEESEESRREEKEKADDAAYYWFIRLIVLRFMDINDFLPSARLIFSDGYLSFASEDTDIFSLRHSISFDEKERSEIRILKSSGSHDEIFRFLLLKNFKILAEMFPFAFGGEEVHSCLYPDILPDDYDGIIQQLITETDFSDPETVGRTLQFFNEERRNEIISIYKGTVRKGDIPAATQVFTPDWVIRYMLDNSLGRYWIERNPNSPLRQKLRFYINRDSETHTYEKIRAEQLTVFDPCAGAGHILMYAFDVLLEIYRECGYTDKDAAVSILKNNLFGLDIDSRASKLAAFLLLMKAVTVNSELLYEPAAPNISEIKESSTLSRSSYGQTGEYLREKFLFAKETGSLSELDEYDYSAWAKSAEADLGSDYEIFRHLALQAEIMSRKYTVTAANPPYMNKYEGFLKEFVKSSYRDFDADLFSVFIVRCCRYTKEDGYTAMMTPYVWMFIRTYEKLREYIIGQKDIVTLIQTEYSSYEDAAVPVCSFVLSGAKTGKEGYFFDLSEFRGGMDVQREKVLEALSSPECRYLYKTDLKNCQHIPGRPAAYWAGEKILACFKNAGSLGNSADIRLGMATGDNSRFVRMWFEVDYSSVGFDMPDREHAAGSGKRWFPYSKGGEYRKWYGNSEYVVRWEKDGSEIRNFRDGQSGRIRSHNYNLSYIFRESLSWTFVSSSKFGVRYVPEGYLFDVGGSSLFADRDMLCYILAFLASKPAFMMLKIINPTMNFQPGNLKALPFIYDSRLKDRIIRAARQNIKLAADDWNDSEISWNFAHHPLTGTQRRIEDAFYEYSEKQQQRFSLMKKNERELNELFTDIYGLSGETDCSVRDSDISIRKADLVRGIKSLISYAVGCIFGRYSLDKDGVVCAGGSPDFSVYSSFIPSHSNIIPLTEEAYFDDDIVLRFSEFIKVSFGSIYFEKNMLFIKESLNLPGSEPAGALRKYFTDSFYSDHVKTYKKRPVYLLYDSGRKKSFRALIYLHRFSSETVSVLREQYIEKLSEIYAQKLSSSSLSEKDRARLSLQAEELRIYDERLCRYEGEVPDLDEGVINNSKKLGLVPAE